MANTYEVLYNIQVNHEQALQAINTFKTAVRSATSVARQLAEVQRQVRSTNDLIMGIGKKPLSLNTTAVKTELEALNKLAIQLRENLATVNIGAVGGGAKRATSTGTSSTTSSSTTAAAAAGASRGKTGHMPLAPRSAVGTASNAPVSQFYNQLSPTDQRRYDGMVRRENRARYRQQIADNRADEVRYQNTLRQYKRNEDAANRARHNASHTPTNSAYRREQWLQKNHPLQSQRAKYLFSNRDAIYARNGANPNAINGPTGYSNASGPYPAPTTPRWRPQRRWNPSNGVSAGSGGRHPAVFPKQPNNLSYKLLGPTPLPNNGGMAVSMLQGMGIAYGIAGAGQMMSNIIHEATEYDNTMKTVENILKTHDKEDNFSGRFNAMTQTIRNVGMETKFKTTEVADAAKFLAMAGLNVHAITKAIRPIANIALVGDTELGETADLVTNIMTAYEKKPEEMNNVADIMTNTFTMSNTTLTEIAESYKYAASLLSAGGVDFADATAAIGVLGDAGIKGSQAGTTLRTLMANIVNPTKKQKQAWEDAKVKLTDDSGRRKDLLQIFQELSKKNLDVGMYYRLFHKTAASGAVALAAHVDKWQTVAIENRLSEGLTKRLADEKKNTLQGLWAQVTSVFTDDGIKAFSGVQDTIKNFLKSTVEFLKTSRAQEMFKEFFQTFMDFGKIILEVSKTFYEMYSTFKPFIMTWMKFQLMIWPVVKALSALKTVMLAIAALRGVGLAIGGFARSFTSLGLTSAAVGANGSMALNAAGLATYGGPLGFLPGVTHKQMMHAQRGLNLKRPHAYFADYGTPQYALAQELNKEQLKNYKRDMRKYHRRLMGNQALNAVSGIASTALIGAGMYMATQDDSNGWDKTASVLTIGAGIAARAGGWGVAIAGVLATLGGISKVLANSARATKYAKEYTEYYNKHKILNGVITGSDDPTMRSLEAVYNKENDINKIIERRIELTREELGLHKDKANLDETSSGIYKDRYEKLRQGGAEDYGKVLYPIVDGWKKDGLWFGSRGTDGVWKPYATPGYFEFNGEGQHFINNGVKSDRAKNATIAAITEILDGGTYQNILSDFKHGIDKRGVLATKGKMTPDDWHAFFDNLKKQYDPQYIEGLIMPSDMHFTDKQLEDMSHDDMMNLYLVRYMLWNRFKQIIEPAEAAVNSFNEAINNGTLNEGHIIDYFKYTSTGSLATTMESFQSSDPSNFFRRYGFWDGTFHEFEGNTSEEAAQLALKNANDALDVLKANNLLDNPAASALVDIFNSLKIQSEAFLETGTALIGEFDGQERDFKGVTYKWIDSIGLWRQVTNDSTNYSNTLADNMGCLNTSVLNLGTTLNGFDWNGMWNGMLPHFTSTPFFGSHWTEDGPTLGTGYTGIGGYNYALGFTNPSSFYPTLSTKTAQKPMFTLSSSSIFGSKNNKFSFKSFAGAGGQANYLSPLKAGAFNNKDGKKDNDGTDLFNTGAHTDTDSNDKYKSKYKNSSAAPKQFIVNIDNLMNVEKVDMSDPNNVAVVDNLKARMSQALVEVVSSLGEQAFNA